jgi:Zn ribbon nucleic-acid-binding protein
MEIETGAKPKLFCEKHKVFTAGCKCPLCAADQKTREEVDSALKEQEVINLENRKRASLLGKLAIKNRKNEQ